jgi:hypothetical protein
MYSIHFGSREVSVAHPDFNSPAFDISMKLDFPEQPTWMEISDKFLEFLKANGYVFDINEQLRTVADNTPLCKEFNDHETTRKPKRKAAKKASKKV